MGDSAGFDRRTVMQGMAIATGAAAAPWLLSPAAAATDNHVAGLDAISETLIPGSAATAPGAYLARVLPNGFLGLTLDHVQTVGQALDRIAGGAFATMDGGRRQAALSVLDTGAFAGDAAGAVETAWKTLKLALLSVYYTSEQGAAGDLVYELVPGRWDPDIPLSAQPRQLSNDTMARLFT